MARATPAIVTLSVGEVTPLLEGREDDPDIYPRSCRRLENMISLPQGPATRRPGTRFVGEIKDSAAPARLIPFEFSTEQAYQIEAGGSYLRFFKDKGRIEVADTDAAIANGTFDAGIADWDNRSTGAATIAWNGTDQRLSLVGASGGDTAWAEQDVTTTATGQEHVLTFRVVGRAGDYVYLRIGTSSTGSEILGDRKCEAGWHAVAFTPSAAPVYVQFRNPDLAKTVDLDEVALVDGAPLEMGSGYAAGDLAGLKWTQSADVLTLTHPRQPPCKLSRTGHTSWGLTEIAFVDGPYLPENTDTTKTLQPGATTGFGVTITAAGHSPFAATDVGRLVRIEHGGTWGWARIVGYTSPTQVTADVKGDFGATTAVSAWRLGLWSATTGYPAATGYHEERQFFLGAAIVAPQRFDASATGDFENFTPGTNDADALAYTIGSNRVNTLHWLASSRVLLLGTRGGEVRVGAEGQTQPLTPSNVDVKFQTHHGCADLAPLAVSSAVLFVQRAGKKLRELAYSIEADGYVAPDITIRASHIPAAGIAEIVFQQEPWSVVWARLSDGALAGLTYRREANTVGWHRHPVGGAAEIDSLSVIPSATGDELWLIAKRVINGATKRYVELLEEPLALTGDPAGAFYVDSGLTYSGASTATITGLDHLEGETVKILADGAAHPDRTVAAGQITLEVAASTVQVGLACPWRVQPQRILAGAREGSAQGKSKAIDRLSVRLHRTLGVRAGRDESTLEEVPFREIESAQDAPPALFTGSKEVDFPGEWDEDADILLGHDGAFPATVVSIVPRVTTNEG